MLLNQAVGLILVVFFAFNVKAQESGYYIARINDKDTKLAIVNSNIINLNNKRGAVSNSSGIFMILASPNDFIRVSYMGYNDIYLKVDLSNQDTLDIYLSKKLYQLDEVKVHPWTKEEFKHQFVSKKMPTDAIEWLRQKYAVSREELIWLTPVSFHNYKTSKERQISQLKTLKIWEKKDDLYKEIVKKMTNYEGEEYISFLEFCHFSKDYISNTREFYLIETVKKKYIEFEKKKNMNQ